MTLSSEDGDLVYVIRASAIDDSALMREVSVEQLVEFLLYVKEVHQLVLDARAARTGRLNTVIFANDISGTRKPPDPMFSKALTASSKSYEKLYPSLAGPTLILNLPFILQADTDSSLPHTLTHTRARSTYLAQPCPASREPLHSECRRGAALACRGDADVHLMTCPALFLALPQAFVGLFKPLFPKVVQARLKFERARLPHPHPHPGRVASGGASPARPSVP